MPGLPPINLPAAQYPQQNQGGQIAQALSQIPQFQQQHEEQQQDRELRKMQLKAMMQQSQTQAEDKQLQLASSRNDLLKQMLLTDPTKASDPQYIKTYDDTMSALKIPANHNSDGSINLSQYQKPFAELDEKQKIAYAQMPKDARAAALKGISGVPQEFLDANQYTTSKDEAALDRAKSYGLSVENSGEFMRARAGVMKERADAVSAADYAKVAQIDNNIKQSVQKLANDTMRAQADMVRSNAAAQNATTRANSLLRNPNGINQKVAAQAITQVMNEKGRLDSSLRSAQASYAAALQNGADPDDPQTKQIQSQIDELKTQRDGIQSQVDQANTILSGELGAAGDLKGASGAIKVDVTPIGKGGGRTVVEKRTTADGRTLVKYSDGTIGELK